MTHKVRNIQNYGAALAIIAQVSDEAEEDLEKKDKLFGYSSGQSLVIPGILIDEQSGTIIKEACLEEPIVIMRA